MPIETRAVALRYDPAAGELPYVTASGRGAVAARIEAVAREHAVPVWRDPELVAILEKFEPGAAIPVAAFAAVAEILAALYALNARVSGGGER